MLYDEIPIGTEYRVYPETIQRGWVYYCGGCRKAVRDIAVIYADNPNGQDPAALPLALFDLVLPFGLESAA